MSALDDFVESADTTARADASVAPPRRARGAPHPKRDARPCHLVQLDGIHKAYDIRGVVLDRVALTIRARDRILVTGRSGCGKTTLLQILGMIDSDFAGEYRVQGELLTDVARGFERHRRALFGFLHQDLRLVPHLSLLDNVALPLLFSSRRRDRREQARVWLERVGLGPRCAHRPNQLSRGERQRVALARAMITLPRILLMDEPTASLSDRDVDYLFGCLETVTAHQPEVAWVVITHQPAHFLDSGVRFGTLELCDGSLIGRERSAETAA